ncbi:FAD-dependent oxidoreductase [Candidatus Nomurabacteria bacterium]|nr:FAD-dependent oxidoreductase [Candidatus Kaiserbacteria bacterium]MCB9810344.1 FAD-dependent oxidoreductase [Candidatus Nomurabacteria bacterium]MCB9818448.1 FAD-dependent oxidoreductase [Candidatus Nomurabacteria bacterium]
MYDLIIIGGGPAGISAGVYASRKQLKTLFITKEWGGQSTVSTDIQNWIGTPSIAGNKLADDLKGHLEAYANEHVEIISGQVASKLNKIDGGYSVTLSDDSTHEGRAVLIASGSGRRRLDIPGAEEFEHKGVTYCASCDGPIFAGQDVAVIGGGNAGFETAAQLLAYAKSVTLLQRGDRFKADPVTVEKVLSHENMTGILNSETKEVMAGGFVNGLKYLDTETNEEKILPVTGIFVEIGMIPNTDFAEGIVEKDEYNRIKIDPWTQKTSAENIWAAGDCTNVKYHQNNISAGDGVRALEDIYIALKTK